MYECVFEPTIMVTTFKCEMFFWVVHRKKEQASNERKTSVTIKIILY